MGPKRIALLIGNSAYKVGPLANPCNDARALSAALKNLCFTTTLLLDASLDDMEKAFNTFQSCAGPDAVLLFYFSGHGLEYKGDNFLIPINAEFLEYNLRSKLFAVSTILNAMECQRSYISIIILDACRSNTFGKSWSKSPSGGLSQVQAFKGTYVAYATAPGRVAYDGIAGASNSPFVSNLLKYIDSPGLTVEAMFKKVRKAVIEEVQQVGYDQTPWDSSCLIDDFFFHDEAVREKKRQAEEERKRKAEEEGKRLAEEERKKKAEEERKWLAEEERKWLAEDGRKRLAEEEKRQAEEERQRLNRLVPAGSLIDGPMAQRLLAKANAASKRLELLYRATQHGFSGRMFHLRCDNKGPTFTIAMSSAGIIFGGYTSVSWESGSRINHSNSNNEVTFHFRVNASGSIFISSNIPNEMSRGPQGPGFGYKSQGPRLYLDLDDVHVSASSFLFNTSPTFDGQWDPIEVEVFAVVDLLHQTTPPSYLCESGYLGSFSLLLGNPSRPVLPETGPVCGILGYVPWVRTPHFGLFASLVVLVWSVYLLL